MTVHDASFINGDLEVRNGDLVILDPDESQLRAFIRSILTDPSSYTTTIRNRTLVMDVDTNYGSRLRRYIGVNIDDILPSLLLDALNEVAGKNYSIKLISIEIQTIPMKSEVKMDIVYTSLGEEAHKRATLFVPGTTKFYV